MLKDAKGLYPLIKATLKKKNASDNFFDKFIQKLESKISANKLFSIVDFHYPVENLDESDLYHLTGFLYKECRRTKEIEMLNPKLWFSENEIKVANNRVIDNANDEDGSTWTVKRILPKGESEWATVMTYKELVNLYNAALLVYNPDTQRDPIIEYRWGERLVSPRVFKTSVREIEQKMIDKRFHSNTITFNILRNGDEIISWDEEENVFEFQKTKDSELAIIDGFHRLSAILSLMSKYPDFVGYMTVNIKNLTVQEAQEFIYQEQKGNKISKSLLKQYDTSDRYMQYTKLINDYGDSETNELFGMMATDSKDVGKSKYVLLNKFSESLETYFSHLFEGCSSARDREVIIRYLVGFFNEVIGLKKDKYINIEKTRKESMLLSDNIWGVLLMIAKELYDDKMWRGKLEYIIKSENWDRDNDIWRTLGLIYSNYNKTHKDITNDYFKNTIKQLPN